MQRDIEDMLFGFGDSWPPDEDTVALVESLVHQYIGNLCSRATNVANVRKKLDKECFMYLVRKDRRKFIRIQKLLKANEELKKAKTMAECDIENTKMHT